VVLLQAHEVRFWAATSQWFQLKEGIEEGKVTDSGEM
jgi:hypothetical protein